MFDVIVYDLFGNASVPANDQLGPLSNGGGVQVVLMRLIFPIQFQSGGEDAHSKLNHCFAKHPKTNYGLYFEAGK
jgi:hypothetical protein